MAFNIVAPQIGSDSIKDNIITLLSNEPPLTIKEIHSRISKNKTISYQAIFKTLKQLDSDGVLEKKGTKYIISQKWIEQLKKFVNNLSEKTNYTQISESQIMEFDTLYLFFETMLDLFSSDILFKECSHKFGGGIIRHLWWPLSFNDRQFEKFKYMGTAHDSYLVTTQNTNIDYLLKSYYEKTGFKGVKLGVDYKSEEDIVTVGDYVIQIFFEPQMKDRIDKLYSNAQDLADAIKNDILEEILSKKTKIKVVLTKNPPLTKIYREKTMSYFK
jgi:DNA-binding PadR family transcriptional regulator